MNARFSSIYGCLVGGAIGDALGTPVEFMRWSEIQRRYGEEGIQSLEMDFEQGLALISDDTQMSLFTANGLLVYDTYRTLFKESPAPEQCIYEAYRDWYHCQCSLHMPKDNHSWLSDLQEMHERRAPGNTCLSALRTGDAGSIEKPINFSKGCGGIMRVAPVALWGIGKRSVEDTDRLAAQAAALTHGHPLGYMPSAALADIISRILTGTRDMQAVMDATRVAMGSLFGSEPCLNELLRMIDQAVELTRNDHSDVENIHAIGEGWTGEEALGIAIYCSVKYQDDFSRAIIAAVNHNGDSDSTGAIAGNIVGARLGMEAIDGKWLRGLELKNPILELASDLYHGCPINEDGTVTDEEWKRKYVAWCHRPASQDK